MKNKILPTPESKESYKMLYMELGPTEAATRAGVPKNTMTKWASRYGWSKARAVPLKPGRPAATVSSYVVRQPDAGVVEADPAANGATAALSPSEALKKAHMELGGRTRTALAQATAAAAEQAASQPPLPVLSTSHLRELAAAASRVFSWDNAAPQVTHNQLIITADQLRQIRMLRESVETEPVETLDEAEERIRSLSTLEGQEKLRKARELLGREQNMEPQTLSEPAQPGPVTYEVKVTS
jgi:hypothetical protein